HVCARAKDVNRDLLYRGKGTRAWGHTLRPDSFVHPICICYLAHLNYLPVPLPFRFCSVRTFQLRANAAKVKAYASGACHPCSRAELSGLKVKRLLNPKLWVWPQYSLLLVASSPN